MYALFGYLLKGKSTSSLKLKKSIFSRPRNREPATEYYFNRASFALVAYGKVLSDIFFAPAIATTSILAGDLFLIIANVLLALGYLTNFAHRIYQHKVSLFEGLLTSLGLVIAIAITLSLIPSISFLPAMSVIAAGTNYVFLVKNVIVPPLKHLLENLFLYFNVDIRGDYYVTVNEKERPESFNHLSGLISVEIERQQQKLNRLAECVPRLATP